MENDVVAPLNIFEMQGEEKYLPISYWPEIEVSPLLKDKQTFDTYNR